MTSSSRPLWLFSSGPLGTDTVDADGRDVRESTVPPAIDAWANEIAAHLRDQSASGDAEG